MEINLYSHSVLLVVDLTTFNGGDSLGDISEVRKKKIATSNRNSTFCILIHFCHLRICLECSGQRKICYKPPHDTDNYKPLASQDTSQGAPKIYFVLAM